MLFAASVVFLLMAGYLDPAIVHRLACHVGIITVAYLIICAFVAAKSIRRLADTFFRGSTNPWFGRPGVVVFLCVMLPCANVVFIIVDNLFFGTTGMGQITSQQVRILVFMGLDFLWIAVLE
jgi:hypothetical protein